MKRSNDNNDKTPRKDNNVPKDTTPKKQHGRGPKNDHRHSDKRKPYSKKQTKRVLQDYDKNKFRKGMMKKLDAGYKHRVNKKKKAHTNDRAKFFGQWCKKRGVHDSTQMDDGMWDQFHKDYFNHEHPDPMKKRIKAKRAAVNMFNIGRGKGNSKEAKANRKANTLHARHQRAMKRKGHNRKAREAKANRIAQHHTMNPLRNKGISTGMYRLNHRITKRISAGDSYARMNRNRHPGAYKLHIFLKGMFQMMEDNNAKVLTAPPLLTSVGRGYNGLKSHMSYVGHDIRMHKWSHDLKKYDKQQKKLQKHQQHQDDAERMRGKGNHVPQHMASAPADDGPDL